MQQHLGSNTPVTGTGCQQHSQLEQQLSTPACPSAQAWEQYNLPSFSTADWGATVQLQGSQAQAWLFIAMGFLVTESFISRDAPHGDHLFRGSLRSARLSCTQVQPWHDSGRDHGKGSDQFHVKLQQQIKRINKPQKFSLSNVYVTRKSALART